MIPEKYKMPGYDQNFVKMVVKFKDISDRYEEGISLDDMEFEEAFEAMQTRPYDVIEYLLDLIERMEIPE